MIQVEAKQFNPSGGASNPPFQTEEMFFNFPVWLDGQGPFVGIRTLTGEQIARPGDWVVIAVHEGVRYGAVIGPTPELFLDASEATLLVELDNVRNPGIVPGKSND